MTAKVYLTLEEFDRLPDDGMRHEVNKGELITMTLPMPRHNRVVRRIYDALNEYLRRTRLGEPFFPGTPFILSREGEPLILRGPDVAYISTARLHMVDPNKRIKGAPDLAVEVVSPNDSTKDMLQKTAQYISAGSHTIWIVYPELKEVRVFEAAGGMRILTEHDALDCPGLLPGFAVTVAELFP